VPCVSDTGALSCLMGLNTMRPLRMTEIDPVPDTLEMCAVNDEMISLSGTAFLRVSGRSKDGTLHQAPVMYVSPVVDNLYLSRTAMELLEIIPDSFPEVESTAALSDTGHTCHLWMPGTPRSPARHETCPSRPRQRTRRRCDSGSWTDTRHQHSMYAEQ
jgi:hypothetical protein